MLVSQPYVAMTLAVMEAFGVTVDNRKFRRFDVRPGQYKGRDYRDRARRLGRQLLLRPGRDHGRVRSPSRGWAHRASRATWRSSTCSNTWAARSTASRRGRRSPAAAPRRRRRHERDFRHGDDPGGRGPVRRRRLADPQRGPHPPQGDATGSPRSPPSCASSARGSTSCPTAW